MKYSFIVPIYNVEKYLERCIVSILSQSFDDYEVLLINDGSTDQSQDICQKYTSVDKRIRFYSKPNGGLSDARNYGLDRALGDYIIFVDSDDYIEKNTCDFFLKYTESIPDIIRGNANVMLPKSQTLMRNVFFLDKKMSGISLLKQSLMHHEMPMAVWINIFRRGFLVDNNLRFKNGILHEDEEFTPRAFLKAESIIDTNFAFYNYIIRPDSITTKKDKRKNAKDMLETCYELETIYNELDDKQLSRKLRNTLVSKYLSIYQDGDLKRYGKEYLPKKFLLRNASSKDTIIKTLLICISPKLYSFVHKQIKGV